MQHFTTHFQHSALSLLEIHFVVILVQVSESYINWAMSLHGPVKLFLNLSVGHSPGWPEMHCSTKLSRHSHTNTHVPVMRWVEFFFYWWPYLRISQQLSLLCVLGCVELSGPEYPEYVQKQEKKINKGAIYLVRFSKISLTV